MIDDRRLVSDPEVASMYVHQLAETPQSTRNPSATVEEQWNSLKTSVLTSAESSLGHTVRACKDWISSTTLCIIEQRRKARLDGRHEEYHQLDKLCRQAFRLDKAEWANRAAKDAEEYLQTGNMSDAFRNFRQLTQFRPNISVPITSESGQLLSDRRLTLQRWKAYFDNLLNKPVVQPQRPYLSED